MTRIEHIQSYWNDGMIDYQTARQLSKDAGYSMARLGKKWVWFCVKAK